MSWFISETSNPKPAPAATTKGIVVRSEFTIDETNIHHPKDAKLSFQDDEDPVNNALSAYWNATNGSQRSVSLDARAGIRDEKSMEFLAECRLYPIAVIWSAVLALTIVMEAYDKVLITTFFGSPQFTKDFGQSMPPTAADLEATQYQIPFSWQTALTSGAVCAEILGLLLHGSLTERFGYRETMTVALIWMCAAVFLTVFAMNIQTLLAAQILCGVPWGILQTLAATYAAEVLPVALRPYLLSGLNMCWVLGQLISLGTVRGTMKLSGDVSYRLPYALQWVWALPLLIAVMCAPESPFWFVRRGRPHEARRNLQRLTKRNVLDVDRAMAVMIQTHKVETRTQNGSGISYLDCFKGFDLRRTEITCGVWMIQALCGGSLIGYAGYFFQQAGFPVGRAFDLNVVVCGVAILGNVIALWLVYKLKRRTLYLWGLLGCVVGLAVAGILALLAPGMTGLNWVVGAVLIVLTFIYDASIGPVCYILVAEIPSTRLRLKTIVLARVAYNICMIASNVVVPRMLNPSGWNWKGKTFLPFLGTSLLCLIWAFFRLPETKVLAHIELGILFQNKADARKFSRFRKGLESSGYLNLNEVERSTSIWHGSRGLS